MIMAMKMRNVLLLVAVTLAWTQLTAAVTLRACTLSYLTSDPSGMDDAAGGAAPITCTSANYKTSCAPGFNAQCMFSLKTYTYICCFPIAGTAPTVLGTATLATLNPGSTTAPKNLKPLCPSGSVGFGTSALTCNSTARDAGCPVTYSCVRAANVYDLSGTPTISLDDVGAASTPQVCCKTQATSDVFSAAGLGTSVVPVAPTTTAASIYFKTTPDATMYLGDDYSTTGISYVAGPAAAPVLQLQLVTLFTPTALAAATTRYHIFMFDSTTNMDCIFIGNIKGGSATADKPNPTLTIPTLVDPIAAVPPALGVDGQAAMVYLDSTTTPATPTYKYSKGTVYKALALPTNTVAHKWVVLVFQTTTSLDFGTTAAAADTTKILLGPGPYGDLVPTTDTTAAVGPGKFTTAYGFLNTAKVKTILGTPIAGTYFYIKN